MESLNYKLSQGRLFESSNGEILSSIHTPQDDHTNSFNREFSSLFSEAQYELPFRKPELWGKIEETLKSIVEGKLSLKRTLEWIRFNSFEAENARFSSKKLVEFFTSNNFNDLFPKIAKLVLDSPSIFSEKKIPILKQDSRDSVILSEKQCACLLAHMFMCLTMKQDNPKLNKLRNFFPLLTKNPLSSSPIKERQGKTQTKYTSQKKEKLKGLFFYFKQFFNKKEHEREIKFTRLGPGKDFPLPNWKNRSELLTDFSIRRGKIEEVNDAVEVSFSDPECGATDLLIGATQQPIKFFTSPELILGILFCERIKTKKLY